MEGTERGTDLFVGRCRTRPVCAKVNGIKRPHHRHPVQENGAQGQEPVGRRDLALGPRGIQAAFKPILALTQAKASASAKT